MTTQMTPEQSAQLDAQRKQLEQRDKKNRHTILAWELFKIKCVEEAKGTSFLDHANAHLDVIADSMDEAVRMAELFLDRVENHYASPKAV